MTTANGVNEHGNRRQFLARARERLIGFEPHNLAHPLPERGPVPYVRSSLLDEADLVGSFVRNAEAARVRVHRTGARSVTKRVLADIVERHGVHRAVLSAEREAQTARAMLEGLGVVVDELSIEAAAKADLGVTSATFAIATTGTLVQESSAAGGRTASLLPRVHLAIVPARRIVASTAEVLRGLGVAGRLPSNLVLITGPSRSGDIEQIIALGVHGPIAVEVVLLGA